VKGLERVLSLLLFDAIGRNDPVFILGQSAGIFIYSRNLYLIFKEKSQKNVFNE